MDYVSRKRNVNVTFLSNLLVFLLFSCLLIIDLISEKERLSNLISSFESSESNRNAIVISFIILYIPFTIYLIKLQFSLTAFDSKKEYYDLYLSKLNIVYRTIECITRISVYVMILLGISKFFSFFSNILEFILSKVDIYIRIYAVEENASPYFENYAYMFQLKEINLYIILFFIILLIWDFLIYFFNLLSKNKLKFNDFFQRFVLQHLVGLCIWIVITLILFNNFFNKLYFMNTIVGTALLSVVMIIYSYVVIKSMKRIREELDIVMTSFGND